MLLRHTFLWLSRRHRLRKWLETSPIAGRLTGRFIAGLCLEDALRVTRQLTQEGFLVTLDHLGENVTSSEEASRSRASAIEAVEALAHTAPDATVSIKLTQFGLDLSGEICEENVDHLMQRAHSCGVGVEFDMESSLYTDRTLNLARRMQERYGRVRVAVQAYLRRTQRDVGFLNAARMPVRLCKGAYKEPESVAFSCKPEVDSNFLRLSRILLREGAYPAFATHDDRLVRAIEEEARGGGIPSSRFEFQMLFGIRRDLQHRLIRDGYRVRLYVPYGVAWYPYFMRRLAERPANVLFLVRSLWRGWTAPRSQATGIPPGHQFL